MARPIIKTITVPIVVDTEPIISQLTILRTFVDKVSDALDKAIHAILTSRDIE